MGWRFRKQYRSGPFRWNVTKNGLGWSWGLLGWRFGISPTGRRFISFSLSPLGLYWIKYFDGNSGKAPRGPLSRPQGPPAPTPAPPNANQSGNPASGSSVPWWKNNPNP